MFYDAIRNDHGLRHDPFKALLAPRPIGWISTIDIDGRPNLAPYSFFGAVAEKPHIVMVSSAGWKDTLSNIRATGEFVCNLATWDLREAVNRSSAPLERGRSEFEFVGLTPVPGVLVDAPRVGEAAAALECRVLQIIQLDNLDGSPSENICAFGQVVGIHIADHAIVDGRFDTANVKPIARLGYRDYSVVDAAALFQMTRPPGGD